MSEGVRCLAVIPARGGSKSVPHKNIRLLGGRPLIGYTIEAALNAPSVDRVLVSTEDEAISRIASELGAEVPFLRPRDLAEDDVPTWPVVLHAIEYLERVEEWFPEVIATLWPTTPFRSAEDIESGLALLLSSEADTVVALVRVEEKHPYWMKRLEGGRVVPFVEGVEQMVQRQDLPPLYVMNGGFTIRRRYVYDWLVKGETEYQREWTLGYVMDPMRSIDINNELDFLLAETVLEKCLSTPNPQRGGQR